MADQNSTPKYDTYETALAKMQAFYANNPVVVEQSEEAEMANYIGNLNGVDIDNLIDYDTYVPGAAEADDDDQFCAGCGRFAFTLTDGLCDTCCQRRDDVVAEAQAKGKPTLDELDPGFPEVKAQAWRDYTAAADAWCKANIRAEAAREAGKTEEMPYMVALLKDTYYRLWETYGRYHIMAQIEVAPMAHPNDVTFLPDGTTRIRETGEAADAATPTPTPEPEPVDDPVTDTEEEDDVESKAEVWYARTRRYGRGAITFARLVGETKTTWKVETDNGEVITVNKRSLKEHGRDAYWRLVDDIEGERARSQEAADEKKREADERKARIDARDARARAANPTLAHFQVHPQHDVYGVTYNGPDNAKHLLIFTMKYEPEIYAWGETYAGYRVSATEYNTDEYGSSRSGRGEGRSVYEALMEVIESEFPY